MFGCHTDAAKKLDLDQLQHPLTLLPPPGWQVIPAGKR
jgi:hypothetical protein